MTLHMIEKYVLSRDNEWRGKIKKTLEMHIKKNENKWKERTFLHSKQWLPLERKGNQMHKVKPGVSNYMLSFTH